MEHRDCAAYVEIREISSLGNPALKMGENFLASYRR
jgi:hypothetical protein